MTCTVPRVELPCPLEHQQDIFLSPARFKVVCCGRRFGKTLLGLVAVLVGHGPDLCFRGALNGGNIWWIAPTYKTAGKIWRDLLRALTGWPGLKKDKTERRVEFPGGGSIEVRSAHDPDALRGDGLDGVVIDEAAFCSVESWEAVRPALADQLGWVIFISTPNGKNWFYDEFETAKTDPDYAAWQRPTSANPRISPAEIVRMRRKLGAYKYARECLAQFVVPGGGMFDARWFMRFERYDDVVVVGKERIAVEKLSRFATVDLAATTKTRSDWTVISSWGVTPNGDLLLLEVVRKQIDGAAILRELQGAVARHNLPAVWIEKTAYDTLLISIARSDDYEVPVRELIPNTGDRGARGKVARAEPAAALAEAGRIWLPTHAPWLDDFEAELLSFPDKKIHDDQVDTLSYAVIVHQGRRRLEDVEAPATTERKRPGPTMDLPKLPSLRPGGHVTRPR